MKLLFTAALALATGLASLGASAADKPPIKVGVLLPESGFMRPNGETYRIAIEMAVDEVNKAGGVNGSQIQLVLSDDQGKPTEAVLLFRRHVSEGVVAELGPISGTAWESVAPLANAMKVPALNYTALKPGISKKPYALRIHPNDGMMVPEGVQEFVKKFPKVKNVVITGDAKEASGASGMKEFAAAAKKLNLNVVDTVSFETRTTDFSPVAIKIKGLNPDAVFISSFSPNALALLKELDVLGVKVPVLANALIWAGSFPQTVTAGADRIYSIGFATDEVSAMTPAYKDFAKRYVASAEKNADLVKPINVSNSSIAYDAAKMLIGVLQEKKIDGTTSPAEARKQITEGLNAIHKWSGLNSVTMQDNGDGYIKSHMIEIDPATKSWRYSKL